MLVSEKEVMTVGVRERILAIRLMEKLSAKPSITETFGIVILNDPTEPHRQNTSHSAGNQS